MQTHPLDNLSTTLPEPEWIAEAAELCRQRLAEPDARVVRTNASAQELLVEFEVVRVPSDGMVRIPLVIPRGEITSFTLLQIVRGGSTITDEATLKSVLCSVEELGYVRAFRIARLKVRVGEPPFRLPTIERGTVSIRFAPAPPNRDPNAIRFWQQNRVGIFRRLLNQFVANPQDLERYIVIPESAIPSSVSQPAPPPEAIARSPFRMRIPIEVDGIYQISGADLESSGVVGSWIDPRHIRLLLRGKDVPLLYLPADGTPANQLRPGDRLVFYGRANPSPFTLRNIYWLIYDPENKHPQMQAARQPEETEPADTAAAFFEKHLIETDSKVLTRSDQFLSILGYRWVWQQLEPNKPFRVEFDLPGLAPVATDLPGVLNLYVHSFPSDSSATVQLRINDVAVGTFSVRNLSDDRKTFKIRSSALREHGNRAEITLLSSSPTPNRAEQAEIYLDNLELWYRRLYQWDGSAFTFHSPDTGISSTSATRTWEYVIGGIPRGEELVVLDVTETHPLVVKHRVQEKSPGNAVLQVRAIETGLRQYVAMPVKAIPSAPLLPEGGETTNLRAPNVKADYIIIAYRDFLAPLTPLVRELEKAGHHVLVVDVQSVYDQFADGEETPEAIKRFLDYAARHYEGSAMHPPASYVLLVGDATSAYRNEFRNHVINYVPTYRMATTPGGAEQWASDHWYTTFFGKDDLADAFIGRLSVNNVRDLENIVAKLVEYRCQPRSEWQRQDWTRSVAFIADHSEFSEPVNRVMETVPPSLNTEKLSLDEEPWEDNFYYPKEIAEAKKAKVSPEMTRKIRDLFNRGAAVVSYFGHGSPNIWSTQRIWFGGDSENSDNLMLRNRDRLPFIMNMTCNSGAIDYPMPRWNICISEDFLRVPNGGAIACYVPSGPGMTLFHEQFSKEINRALFAEQTEPVVPALTLAGWRYILQEGYTNLVRMFIYLGDPALSLHLLQSGGMFQLGLAKAEELSLVEMALLSDRVVDVGTTVAVRTRLRNNSRVPARDVIVSLSGSGLEPTEAPSLSFLPGEEREVVLSARVGRGLCPVNVRVTARQGGSNVLRPEPTVAVCGRQSDESVPLLISKELTEIEYRNDAGLPTAVVRSELFNLTSSSLPAFTVALEDVNGALLEDTRTSVPALSAGQSYRFELVRPYRRTIPDREEVRIRPELPDWVAKQEEIEKPTLTLGLENMPDLAILPGGILPHKAMPVDGETVFFRVAVENRGGTVARNVRVDAYDGETSTGQPLLSRILKKYDPVNLAPGERGVVSVRWDPFQNAGEHELLFRVWGACGNLEKDLTNNSRTIRLRVLEKYRLKPAGLTVIPPESSGPNANKLRVRVKVRNEGESPAHGVKVVVYRDRKSKMPSNVLGETLIEEIAPKSEQEIEIVYDLKPEDAGKRFEPVYEVFLKGSLQRVPWPE
ncbi:MAG: C25 family cysteine peptidase [Candidatus Sumerlaea chitinivorans]|nr:C25 family cysteine peptidase [Candidatus Sumerlaea chitinivorans]